MRYGVRITALTKKGTKALELHEIERASLPWMKRQAFEGLYRETVESKSPLTVVVMHKNDRVASLIPFDSMVVPIKEGLGENGAVYGKDYALEKVGGTYE